jgi:hypothetical protein
MHPLPLPALPRLTVLGLAIGVIIMGQAQVASPVPMKQGANSLQFRGMSHHPSLVATSLAKAPRGNAKVLSSPLFVIDTAIVDPDDGHYIYGAVVRCLYDFDAQGNRVSELYQEESYQHLSSDPYYRWVWENDFRLTSAYDGQGNRLSCLEDYWENGQWLNSDHLISTYDGQGNELSRLEEWWSNGQWVNLNRSTSTYDANGNQLSEVGEYWSGYQSTWLNDFRHTFTYDGQGNELSDLEEWWSDSQWVNSRRYAYTYDVEGKMLSNSSQYWSNGQWVNLNRYVYTYDGQGNILVYVEQRGDNDQWVDVGLVTHTYTYDASGHVLMDSTDYRRTTFTYDAHGNVTTWTHDSYFHSYWGYGWAPGWGPENTNFARMDGAGNTYSFWGSRDTLHYKMIVTEVASEGETVPRTYALSQNFPNPFNPSTTIGYALPQRSHVTLTVCNALGQLIATLVNSEIEPGHHSVRFDASALASGVYFYRLQAGSFGETKKLLLVH